MAPRSWTTQEQYEYLESEVPAFLEAQKEKFKYEALATFHKRVFQTFFRRWPIDANSDDGSAMEAKKRVCMPLI